MEYDIFTKEQQGFHIKGTNEVEKNRRMIDRLLTLNVHNEISLNSIDATNTFNETINYLRSRNEDITKSLAPFEERNRQFEVRRDEIIKAHGFSVDDMYDRETIDDIVKLKDEMQQESSQYNIDFTGVSKSKSEIDEMFKSEAKSKEEFKSLFK